MSFSAVGVHWYVRELYCLQYQRQLQRSSILK